MNQNIQSSTNGIIISAVIFTAGVVVVGILFYLKADEFLRLKTIDNCAHQYQIEYSEPEKNTKIIKPHDDLFKDCLWKNGIKNYW